MEPSFLVFAQRDDARLDVDALSRHARRFFEADVALADAHPVDAARLTVSSKAGIAGTRTVYGRAAVAGDYELANTLERTSKNAGGLGLLARRCHRVWLVPCEDGTADHVALLVAAILAAVDLGPIVAPERDAIFGVKTARLKLETFA
jgi:hypothetical protein